MYTLLNEAGTPCFKSCIFAAMLLCSILNTIAHSQPADVPHIISYQGQLQNRDGHLISGKHQIFVTLYSDPHSTNVIWKGEYNTDIVNGIFNVALGTGKSPLPAVQEMNRPLWVGIKIDGNEEMQPLTTLASVPYAMNVPDKSITIEKLAPEVLLGMHSEHTPTIQATPNWTRTLDAYSRTNSTPDYLGTNSSGGDLEIRTQNEHAVRYEFISSGIAPNIIGGYSGNTIATGAEGSIIAGGGQSTYENSISEDADYAVISGGTGNSASMWDAVVAGGQGNSATGGGSVVSGGIANLAGGYQFSVVAGGSVNTASGPSSVVSGGTANEASGYFSVVSGGKENAVTHHHATVSGGYRNTASNEGAVVAGGGDYDGENSISYGNTASGSYSVVSGGEANIASSIGSVVSGGGDKPAHSITLGNKAEGDYSVVSGGKGNVAHGSFSVVAGGGGDPVEGPIGGPSYITTGNIANGNYSTISGGTRNNIEGVGSVISGGSRNQCLNGIYAVISGGTNNFANEYAVVGGGTSNEATGNYSTVVGGDENDARGKGSFIGGGIPDNLSDEFNNQGFADQSAIVGGAKNVIGTDGDHKVAQYSFIGGGNTNKISEYLYPFTDVAHVATDHSVITGGELNKIGMDQTHTKADHSFIGGGELNKIAVDVDNTLADHSFIGGGNANEILNHGRFACIPGGNNLIAKSYAQTVIGSFNENSSSSTLSIFKTTNMNDRIFIIGNGTGSEDRSNAFEVSNNGHSIVYDVNGTGGASPGTPRSAIRGATYEDNIIYAWGIIPAATTSWSASRTVAASADFGVTSITETTKGVFTIVLNSVKPDGSSMSFRAAAPVATLTSEDCFSNIKVTPIYQDPGSNTFTVTTSQIIQNPTSKIVSCTPSSWGFTFIVTGRE